MKDASRLTLEEKVGQLFCLGFNGAEPSRETRELLNVIHPGALVLSQRNFETFEQTVRLTSSFVEGREIPALVGVHQEGGGVDRLKQLFAPIPSVYEAAANGTSAVRQLARIIGGELSAAGFNLLFGPVLDLGAPGSIVRDRTFAATPASVTRLGKAFIEEVSESQVLVCGKHFPGMGSASRDPHFALPLIEKTRKLLQMEDMAPFANLFGQLPAILVGHASYPALGDPRVPASLSPRVVEGLLRRSIGFKGVIVTDDLTMGAISSIGLTPSRFLEAFEAGNDLIQFSQTTALVEEGFSTIVAACRKSAALRNRLNASVERILTIKRRIPPAVRNRSYLRTRVLRQVEKLRKAPVSTTAKPSDLILSGTQSR
jgi:beta-N-acetylhexosaminidase